MRMKYIFTGIFTISLSVMAGSDLSKFSPGQKTIKGETYPRVNQVLYRGMEKYQFELDKAIKSMLGDKSALIETKLFSTIKFELQGKSFPVRVNLNNTIQNKIDSYKDQNTNISEAEAAKEAINILDSYFSSMSSSRLIDNYVDYRSGKYVDWPNDIVFSSLIQPAAGTYGYNMAMIKEKSPRSIDLNFYNFVNNGNWFDHTRDVGEFAAYGYILSEDIVGFQLRDPNGSKGWHKIRYTFIKRTKNNTNYIEVYDGKHPVYNTPSSCMALDSADKLFHCNYRPGSLAMKVPRLSDTAAELIGYIVKCNKDDTEDQCMSRQSSIIDSSKLNDQKIHSSTIRKIENIKLRNGSVLLIN